MPRRIYPRPPITEAVVDFRFSPTVTGERLLAAVRDALGDSYTGQVKQQELLQLQATRGPTGVAAAARTSLHLTLLTSEDGLRLVGCGDGMLSVHVLAPYPGWEVFLEQTTSVVRAASSLISESGFNQIAVRYIDRIALPVGDGVSFNDLLVAFPAKPEAMPDSVFGFQYVTQTLDPTDGTVASMVLASAPPDASTTTDDGSRSSLGSLARTILLFFERRWSRASRVSIPTSCSEPVPLRRCPSTSAVSPRRRLAWSRSSTRR